MGALETATVLVSLTGTLLATVTLVRSKSAEQRDLWLLIGLVLPPILLLVPFAASADHGSFGLNRSANYACYLIILAVIAAFAALCWRLHRVAAVAGNAVPGALGGAVVSLSSLHALGRFLQGRLVVVKDPNDGFGPIFERLWEQKIQMGIPLGALAAVVIVVDRRAQLAALLRKLLAWPVAARKIRWASQRSGWVLAGCSLVAVAAAYGLPLAGPSASGAHLTFLGARTPEFGVYALFAALGVLMARQRRSPSRFGWWKPRPLLRDGYAIAALVVVGAAAVLSAARNDLGSLVAIVAGFTAARVTLYANIDADALDAAGVRRTGRSHPAVRYSRQWMTALLVTFALVMGLSVAFDKLGRFEAWADPWQFPFTADSTCHTAVELGLTDADLRPAVPVPDGVEACIIDGSRDLSRRSQVARGLLSVESGGLWGRGLGDTYTGRIQLPLFENDFVVATIWSKMGGAAVLLVALQLIALGACVLRTSRRRAVRWSELTSVERTAALYAAAMAAAVTWSGVFVLATNLGVLPHSGVAFPLVAEGSQSAAALVLGIGLLVLMASASAPAGPAGPAGLAGGRSTTSCGKVRGATQATRNAVIWARTLMTTSAGTVAAAGAVLALLLWGLAYPMNAWWPYGVHHPVLNHGWDDPDARARAAGVRPDVLQVPGWSDFEWIGGRWQPRGDDKTSLDQMWAFGTTYANGDGLTDGLLKRGRNEARRSFLDRLRPPGTEQARKLTLSVDVPLQEQMDAAIRLPDDGGGRVATGVSVIDAASGRVRVLGSAPSRSDLSLPMRLDDALDRLNAVERERSNSNGFRSRTTGGKNCAGPDCIAVTWRQRNEGEGWLSEDPVPSTYQGLVNSTGSLGNRAAQRAFGPGSVFKVVVAAAYLEQGGSIEDHVDSPPYLSVGDRDLENVYGGSCPGTIDGHLTLAQALAVSCNTTFVLLARDLGWSRIADTAQRLGLPVVGREVPPCTTAGGSSVPEEDASGIENLALGGGDIRLTPLAVATLMATVANHGERVAPRPVTGPGMPDECRVRALSPEIADALRSALTLTVTNGTLQGIADNRRWAGKSGTQVLNSPAGRVDRNLWVAGFVDTDRGPVAFAIVGESVGTESGRNHVRHVAAALVEEVGRGE